MCSKNKTTFWSETRSESLCHIVCERWPKKQSKMLFVCVCVVYERDVCDVCVCVWCYVMCEWYLCVKCVICVMCCVCEMCVFCVWYVCVCVWCAFFMCDVCDMCVCDVYVMWCDCVLCVCVCGGVVHTSTSMCAHEDTRGEHWASSLSPSLIALT